MEEWEFDFEWLKVRHLVKENLQKDKLPDLNAVLFLIGIQELGEVRESFTKEEKQDLMHIAVCKLLSFDGIFEYIGRDEDNWPHYKQLVSIETTGVKAQEQFLKEKVIQYFKILEKE